MRADRAFGLLLLVAIVSGGILVVLLAVLAPHAARIVVSGPARLSDVITLVLLVLATCGISLGLASLLRQLVLTVGLIRSLVARRVTPPRSVAVLARELGLDGRVDVVADERPFSFCYWFRSPRVCLSTALVRRLGRDELRAVLAHERYHLRQRDPLRLVIVRYLAAGIYVVPAIDELASFYALEKEVAADLDAVRHVGVAPLARALYKLLPGDPERQRASLAPVSGLSVTEARIERLVTGSPLRLRLSRSAIALSAGALLGASVLVMVSVGTAGAFESLPRPFAVASLLLGPASLLLAAALAGATHQARLLAGAVARS